MNYDTIILEMLSRIQALEQQVEQLMSQAGTAPASTSTEKVSTQDIQNYIEQLKQEAAEGGKAFLQIKANDIHKALRLKSRFPMVCNAMRHCMQSGDVIVHETPSGMSSTLEIRYYFSNTNGAEKEGADRND